MNFGLWSNSKLKEDPLFRAFEYYVGPLKTFVAKKGKAAGKS